MQPWKSNTEYITVPAISWQRAKYDNSKYGWILSVFIYQGMGKNISSMQFLLLYLVQKEFIPFFVKIEVKYSPKCEYLFCILFPIISVVGKLLGICCSQFLGWYITNIHSATNKVIKLLCISLNELLYFFFSYRLNNWSLNTLKFVYCNAHKPVP